MSSSDTRHDGSEEEELLDPEATRPSRPVTLPMPDDIEIAEPDEEGEEATVMARIPEQLVAESKEVPTKGGLRQMFPREPAPARAALPSVEGDALLDMLFRRRQRRTEGRGLARRRGRRGRGSDEHARARADPADAAAAAPPAERPGAALGADRADGAAIGADAAPAAGRERA